jgi:hypothetical protein
VSLGLCKAQGMLSLRDHVAIRKTWPVLLEIQMRRLVQAIYSSCSRKLWICFRARGVVVDDYFYIVYFARENPTSDWNEGRFIVVNLSAFLLCIFVFLFCWIHCL